MAEGEKEQESSLALVLQRLSSPAALLLVTIPLFVYCIFLLAPLGALSRRSDRDNRQPIPSHPTYSSDCSKPFYSDLKQTVTDRDCL